MTHCSGMWITESGPPGKNSVTSSTRRLSLRPRFLEWTKPRLACEMKSPHRFIQR
jgi:hypothetical protein